MTEIASAAIESPRNVSNRALTGSARIVLSAPDFDREEMLAHTEAH
jgi:hypothetical protein